MAGVRSQVAAFASAHDGYATFVTAAAVALYAGAALGAYVAILYDLWLLYAAMILLGGASTAKCFVIQHDCGHGSMFSADWANRWVGRLCSYVTTMPFAAWKLNHDEHHHTVGDLSQAGVGDTALLTVEQYRNASPLVRVGYRVLRSPLMYLVVVPFFYFFILYKLIHVWEKKYRMSTLLNNLFLVLTIAVLASLFGFVNVLLVFVPMLYLGGAAGIFLFYLQHNYPDVRWYRHEEWDFETASLTSASYIKMPQPLEWFTQAIGYHHVHHLHSKIPGYRLRECYEHTRAVHKAPLTFSEIVQSFKIKLWSFEKGRLVTFKEAETLVS
jgi:omega-6 fatty acid desaturase (delta-12 desaturase)